MSVRYNRSRITSTVNALAVLFQVPVSDLMISHGAAAVMHGVCDSTEDIDIQLHSGIVWEKLTYQHKVYFDSTGSRILFPGIAIRKASGMRIPGKFSKLNGLMVQTLDSLEETYRNLIDHPGDRWQSKQDQDIERHTKIVEMIKDRDLRVNDTLTLRLRHFAPQLIDIPLLEHAAELIGDVGEGCISTTYKDHHHQRHLLRIEGGKLYVNVPRVGEYAPPGSVPMTYTREQLLSLTPEK